MTVNRISPTADTDLLAAFANLGHEGEDELASEHSFRAWWAAESTDRSARTLTRAGLERLRDVRQTIRALGLVNNGVDLAVDLGALGAVPLRLAACDRLGLRALEDADLADHVTALLAAALLRASARPGWSRLKACPGPDCSWVFVDRSRNGSRRWCQMSECGNRAKGAAFRARARSTQS